MARHYYTLLSRDDANSPWAIEFGDYDRDCVTDELNNMAEHRYRRANLKIIVTPSARQSVIDAVVAALNYSAEQEAMISSDRTA